MDVASLTVAATGSATLILGAFQWRRGRQDSRADQVVADELKTREQTLDELRELAQQRKDDADAQRQQLRDVRQQVNELREQKNDLQRANHDMARENRALKKELEHASHLLAGFDHHRDTETESP